MKGNWLRQFVEWTAGWFDRPHMLVWVGVVILFVVLGFVATVIVAGGKVEEDMDVRYRD